MLREPRLLLTGLVLTAALSGCYLPDTQSFPVEFINASDETVVFQVEVVNTDDPWTSSSNWTVEAGKTYERQWTLVTHDRYDIRVSIGEESVGEDIRACANRGMTFTWDGSELDFRNRQGDGWAGC